MSEAALSIIAKSYKHPRVNEWVSVDKQHKVDNTMDTIQHLKQKKKSLAILGVAVHPHNSNA